METTETVIVPNIINITEGGFSRSYNHDHVIGLIEDRRKFEQYKDRLKSVLRENYSEYPDAVVAIAEEMDVDLSFRKKVTVTITAEVWITTNEAHLEEYEVDQELNVNVDFSTYSDKFEVDDYDTDVVIEDLSEDD